MMTVSWCFFSFSRVRVFCSEILFTSIKLGDDDSVTVDVTVSASQCNRLSTRLSVSNLRLDKVATLNKDEKNTKKKMFLKLKMPKKTEKTEKMIN